MNAFPIVSDDPRVQQHYERCRRAGTSHSLAEMFALAAPPMSNTDREFLEGHCNGSQFQGQPSIGDRFKAQARAAGVDPTGKVYVSGLAEFPGDPGAWVAGRGDVQRRCEEKGWDCAGAVTVKSGVRAEPTGGVAVADDIVQAEVETIAAACPEPARVDRADLTEQVKARRKPHWVK